MKGKDADKRQPITDGNGETMCTIFKVVQVIKITFPYGSRG
jgi:hypothetical protein